jgi:predicted enzyme related to lactoylglutathione lyase
MIMTGSGEEPGIDGGLLPRSGPDPTEGQPVISYVCTIEVPALDSYMERAEQLGGSIAVPKAAIPGVGWLAYAKDPEGNLIGLMQPDTGAA